MDSAGAKSVMSNDVRETNEGKEEILNVIRGHKASLSNPSTFICSWFVGKGRARFPT